jgi:5-(carboxyamino)imidazole ribonucleotide synthase
MKVGILGSGQLARMLALAGYPLGLQFTCYSPEESPTSADVMPHHRGAWNDEAALWAFAADRDVITFETENIPLATASLLKARGKRTAPDVESLKISQDRLLEKNFLRTLGIPTAPYYDIATQQDLHETLAAHGIPHILKTRLNGYDGKNQYRIESFTETGAAWTHVNGMPSILEECINFDYEVSLIAVRERSGTAKFYPLTQNLHRNGILVKSLPVSREQAKLFQAKAEGFAKLILEELDYVGVLAIEYFILGDRIIVNEMAPRVHNSGHWTIDAAMTSQFENHLRAITGVSLGDTNPTQEFIMFNLLGFMPRLETLASVEALRIHDYRKQPAAQRKLGHLTLLQPSPSRIRLVEDLISEEF